MNITEIMTDCVVTVGFDEPVWAVRATMERHAIHHLVVVEQGSVVGVISDRDVLRSLSPFIGTLEERRQDVQCMQRRAHQIMHRNVVVARPSMTVEEAARLMLDRNVSCLPVLDGQNRCVGIVTIHDVLRWMVEDVQCEPRPPRKIA